MTAHNQTTNDKTLQLLERIAIALESAMPHQGHDTADLASADAFLWHAGPAILKPIKSYTAQPLDMLVGIEKHAKALLENTERFAQGYPANNALLWGARGMGKSSLVKAVHQELVSRKHPIKLIEILREDLNSLPSLLDHLRAAEDYKFLLFCDDLSFDEHDSAYKSLKTVLEGGVQGRPENVLFYATSNRRHLIARQMIENESRGAIHGGESVEEKVSLSDRFGLWLGFYPCAQDQFFEMVETYTQHYKIKISKEDLRAQALEWSMTRGSRSGRVAWQFVQHLAGAHKIKI